MSSQTRLTSRLFQCQSSAIRRSSAIDPWPANDNSKINEIMFSSSSMLLYVHRDRTDSVTLIRDGGRRISVSTFKQLLGKPNLCGSDLLMSLFCFVFLRVCCSLFFVCFLFFFFRFLLFFFSFFYQYPSCLDRPEV